MARIIKALSLITLLSITSSLNAALPASAAPRPKPTATPQLKLSVVADKTEYVGNETIKLTYRLENISSNPISICALADGTVHVAQVTHEGRTISGQAAELSHLDTIPWDWLRALKELAPGEYVEFVDAIPPDIFAANGPRFDDVTITPGTGKNRGRIVSSVVTYPSQGTGTYVLKLFYKYNGPTAGRTNVYTSSVAANDVVFTIR